MSIVRAEPVTGSETHNPAPDELDGMNIFWILFALTCASSIHNLGSAPGFPAGFRRYFRVLPLCGLFDTLLLYIDFMKCWQHQYGSTTRHGASIRHILKSARVSAREVAIRRLAQTQPGDDDTRSVIAGAIASESPDGLIDRFRISTSISSLLDFWPRFFANAGLIFVYTKINGFTNVEVPRAIATVCFISWIGMEIILYVAFGFGIRGGDVYTRNHLSSWNRGSSSVPVSRRKSFVQAIGLLLVIGQVAGLLAVFIPAVVSSSRQAGAGEGSNLVSLPTGEVSEEGGEGGQAAAGPLDFVRTWYTQVVIIPLPWVFRSIDKGADLGDFFVAWSGDNVLVIVLTAIVLILWTVFGYIFILPVSILVFFFLAFLPFLLVITVYICGKFVAKNLPVLSLNAVRWARGIGVRRWRLFCRLAIGALIAGALVYFKIYFDGRQTGKDDWTGKLD